MASVLSFWMEMVRGEHWWVVLFVAFRLASDYFFHYHCVKKLYNRYIYRNLVYVATQRFGRMDLQKTNGEIGYGGAELVTP